MREREYQIGSLTSPIGSEEKITNTINSNPIQIQFLKSILQRDKTILDILSARNRNLIGIYWGVEKATYEDLASIYGTTRRSIQSIISRTMEKLWDKSPQDIKDIYSYDEVIRGKNIVSLETRGAMSIETRAKISAAMKGKGNPMFGRQHSPEAKAKISSAKKGKPGPMLGRQHSSEARAKMSSSAKGHTVSAETRAKISAVTRGRTRGEMPIKTRAKISAAMKGRPNPMLGRKHSPETKAKISATKKGHSVSSETRAKISVSLRDVWQKKSLKKAALEK